MGDLHIPEGLPENVGGHLVTAANLMVAGDATPTPGRLRSLTGIGAEVEQYLEGLSIARAALADAAVSASRVAGALRNDSGALDHLLAGALSAGFAVQGGR